ncbi:hypothetical protein LZ518_08505 [Sphingomonas sp. RB56-2]|uniref:Uncharacterized protein n=1 Tax=Sphingomonas brevis TaxID=2908206 RepID=A0ABT0SAL0_9SPHN|nr:hypothetical protein [Sphingomonas brevis]MCL6741170.1 hypothetical protein [Sphingomonas brevis]
MNRRREFALLAGCLAVGIFIALNWSPLLPSKHSASHVIAALNYRNEAATIENKVCGPGVACTPSQEDWDAIYSYYERALSEARQADILDLNRQHPGFGDHFKNEFIEGLAMIVEAGNEPAKRSESIEGQILVHRFGDWFEANEDAIRNGK